MKTIDVPEGMELEEATIWAENKLREGYDLVRWIGPNHHVDIVLDGVNLHRIHRSRKQNGADQ